ncbi:hypothetical protein Tery_2019 [Trichodesmium erythraeum IMS101]|uniref:Uncharacterized protein n=1 Tax=Trichodesmium erythraeum (strain IMS101) TaxID=203124 RepID=Q113Q7_TRIEI|nr:hypothetical protein [Trichodesmium erythraeum GBRTRLIN201]MCH2051303.1 hypothetical protein [Trichodesmium sp. ALOHA_ZT_67]
MQLIHELFDINTRLNIAICRPILILLSSIFWPLLSQAQLPRFDYPIPQSPSQGKQSSTTSPSSPLQSKSSEQSIINDSTPSLQLERQLPLRIIKPVNGFVNIKLTNKTAAKISYEVIGDTTQRQLSGKSEVILKTLKVPINITFYRETGGFLFIQTLFTSEKCLLELIMTETNDFNLDKSSLLIEETGSLFLN